MADFNNVKFEPHFIFNFSIQKGNPPNDTRGTIEIVTKELNWNGNITSNGGVLIIKAEKVNIISEKSK